MNNINEKYNVENSDKERPSAPRNLSAKQIKKDSVTLIWETPDYLPNPLAHYLVQPNFKPGVNTSKLEYQDIDDQRPHTCTYFISAVDTKGNRSNPSNILYVFKPEL